MRLYDALPTSVEYGGKAYKLRPAWPNVLAAMDVLEDENLPDVEQVGCALDLLIAGQHPVDSGLLQAAIKTLVPSKEKSNEPPVMDFEQDCELIYAAFWQTYGINLNKCRNMHWCEFFALLKGLPEGTRFADVVGVRQTPMPKPTKDNAEYRARLSRMKAKYALKKHGLSVQDGLTSMFNSLKSMAKGGG